MQKQEFEERIERTVTDGMKSTTSSSLMEHGALMVPR